MSFFTLALTMWPYLRTDVNYPQIEVISMYDSKTDKHFYFYLFIQHLLNALYTNKHALMRYLINIYTQ